LVYTCCRNAILTEKTIDNRYRQIRCRVQTHTKLVRIDGA